ncbi:hypothetical protein C7B76_28990 [filamentous cyanobacterium CCP2]|nr:hypothetical protein C7B76_28990 [filamentous cyanobacterium CCP2]
MNRCPVNFNVALGKIKRWNACGVGNLGVGSGEWGVRQILVLQRFSLKDCCISKLEGRSKLMRISAVTEDIL